MVQLHGLIAWPSSMASGTLASRLPSFLLLRRSGRRWPAPVYTHAHKHAYSRPCKHAEVCSTHTAEKLRSRQVCTQQLGAPKTETRTIILAVSVSAALACSCNKPHKCDNVEPHTYGAIDGLWSTGFGTRPTGHGPGAMISSRGAMAIVIGHGRPHVMVCHRSVQTAHS